MEENGDDNNKESETNPNKSTSINSFIEITASTPQEASFFLESHNWDLDLAVSTFLDDSTAAGPPPPPPSSNRNHIVNHSISNSPSPVSSPDYSPSSRSRTPSPSPSRNAAYSLRPNNKKIKKNKKKNLSKGGISSSSSRSKRGAIRTIADLTAGPVGLSHDDGDEDEDVAEDDDDYEPEEEESGDKGNDVDEIFSRASKLAVERPSDHASSSRSFTGTARTLSGDTLPSEPEQPANTNHTITFWRNGFTVDDGPLRRMDDPANASFLEDFYNRAENIIVCLCKKILVQGPCFFLVFLSQSIKKSECPSELEPSNRNIPVHVNLVRREDDYHRHLKSEKRKTSFHGVGRTLGSTDSVEPTVVSTILTSAPAPSLGLVVDTSAPTTSIQLRLADGTRMVSRFNLYHTISDLRAFIDASRPGGQRNYQLQMMGFPPKPLTNLTETVEQAGIANSVVIQKI
ncbi:hypothetical protein ACFE04_016543 [Oxalis oulophora]